jgi:hypothetical protein
MSRAHALFDHPPVRRQQRVDFGRFVGVPTRRFAAPHHRLPFLGWHRVRRDRQRGQEAVQRFQIEALERHRAGIEQVGQAVELGVVEQSGGGHGGDSEGKRPIG